MLPEYLNQLFYLIGQAVVFLAAAVLLISVLIALLILYSFKTGNFFAARYMLLGIMLLEDVIKSLFWVARADDSMVDDVGVRLRNYINTKKFLETPYEKRFIFMPQCLRSVQCPAKLTPEGIMCIDCGRCGIGEAKKYAESLGYRFYVVPGSSFIKRIIKKGRPGAIVGVGCSHSHGIPARGVPLSTSGCVATSIDWEAFYEAIAEVPSTEKQGA